MAVVAGLVGLAVAPLLWRVADVLAGARCPRGSVTLWTAASLAAVGFANPDPVATAVLFPLAVAAVVLAHVDAAVRLLPDAVVLVGYPVVGAVYITAGIALGDAAALLRVGAAGFAGLAGFAALAAVGGMGFGDAKLAGLLGLALGWISWGTVTVAGLLAFVFAAPPALAGLALRGRRATIPFGPPLLLGALFAVLTA